MKRTLLIRTLSLAALMFAALGVPSVQAARPPGGGTGGGTIYYQAHPSGYWTMNSDGSGKAQAPVGGEPSRLLHGGYRWFLQSRPVAGTYPNGRGRVEIFAVRGDGNEAFTRQLTDSPVVELVPETRGLGQGNGMWLAGDVGISQRGRLWDAGSGTDCADPPYPELNACVLEGGIYGVDVTFDGAGNVDVVPTDPGAPITAVALYRTGNDETRPNVEHHDWSPSASAPEIVYSTPSTQGGSTVGLKVFTAGTGLTRILTTEGGLPRWSPDGTRILFGAYSGIYTIAPTGAGLQQIIRRSTQYSVFSAQWSPTGSHITYCRAAGQIINGTDTTDVYRATASGGSQTNLTDDGSGYAVPFTWR